MSGPVGSSTWFGTPGYTLEQSLRFDRTRDCSLVKTFGSAGNRRTFTISLWIKSTETSTGYILEGGDDDSDGSRAFLRLESGLFRFAESAGQEFTTDAIHRDPAAWYHVVLAVDTTQGTNTNRIKFYINGEVQTFSTINYPSQNHDYGINKAAIHTIGRSHLDNNNPINAYFAEYHFLDGYAYGPENFGVTNEHGAWGPKEYTGAYGTNGFYLSFAGGGLISATGGTITTDGNFKVHSFTSNGTFTPTVTGHTQSDVEYLVIAGGGGGGGGHGGGGGAGGFRTGFEGLTSGTGYGITVGAGGVYGEVYAGDSEGHNGGNSSIAALVVSAGGGGGGGYGQADYEGRDGGSGGGGVGQRNGATGGAASTGQGFAGGTSAGSGAGGGGGASAVGANAAGSGGSATGGNGGAGLASSITGSSVTRAGGGGGGCAVNITPGSGGSGGGGAGSGASLGVGVSGTANTGGGGGGGGGTAPDGDLPHGGTGGSGIVIIRYRFQ